jgi:hypothetical protein
MPATLSEQNNIVASSHLPIRNLTAALDDVATGPHDTPEQCLMSSNRIGGATTGNRAALGKRSFADQMVLWALCQELGLSKVYVVSKGTCAMSPRLTAIAWFSHSDVTNTGLCHHRFNSPLLSTSFRTRIVGVSPSDHVKSLVIVYW